ncbi:MAG: Response regulator receiver domain [Patescibacteria group bacterium]|nr:Response regulator receiver domain [Patescibacteria group bacterium]
MQTLSVLIVHTEARKRTIIRGLLGLQLGINYTDAAEHTSGAISKLKGGYHYDMVICQYNMAGQNGLDVLSSLRKIGKYYSTPFILLVDANETMNGKSALESIEMLKDFSAVSTLDELAGTVRRVISRHTA